MMLCMRQICTEHLLEHGDDNAEILVLHQLVTMQQKLKTDDSVILKVYFRITWTSGRKFNSSSSETVRALS